MSEKLLKDLETWQTEAKKKIGELREASIKSAEALREDYDKLRTRGLSIIEELEPQTQKLEKEARENLTNVLKQAKQTQNALAEAWRNLSKKKPRKIAIIVHSGTLDKILCAFILGSTSTTLDWDVHMYFTFWGLNVLKKGGMEDLGLPAIYKDLEPSLKKKLEEMNYPTPYEMLQRMKQSGKLTLYACTPTMEMFDIKEEDLIPEVDKLAGAATFLDEAANADITIKI
ncbi:MAG: DsrE/DsrF/DrsH-like family protein [Promethearchaeota archaeon]|jgi:peroxiredoxin family protein